MTEPETGTLRPGDDSAADELAPWPDDFDSDSLSLAEMVNRLLDKGVVISGEVTISVAGIDLVYLGLNALLTSVSTAREQLGRARLPESSE